MSVKGNIIYNNKRELHNYDIIDTYEAGIVLNGWEVKSVKSGTATFSGTYVKQINNELYLVNSDIKPYSHGRKVDKGEQTRDRKLLLNKYEIKRISASLNRSGYTVVISKVYLSRNLIKLEIAVVKGKKKYDNKRKMKEKDLKRRMQIELKESKYV